MLLVKASKYLIFAFCMIPLAAGAVATSILFSSLCVAISKNPEESENLFNNALMGFALVETFVFLSIGFSLFIFFVF